ncbi:MAG: cyclopropane-fatty-acyl-phospholipid synthase family protein [Rhodospirillales bacterium]
MESATASHSRPIPDQSTRDRPFTATVTAVTGHPSWLERRLIARLRNVRFGSMRLTLPSGARIRVDGDHPGPQCDVVLRSPMLLFRLMGSGDLGLAEGYMAGEFDTEDLSDLLRFGMANEHALEAAIRPSVPVRFLCRVLHGLNVNSRGGSRRNIAAHYDLGNEFYRLWLDSSMTYSAAIFETPDEPLETAQIRKYRRLADSLGLKSGDRVLEIGCGWGGFAEIAARDYGCHVVGLTLSVEQAAYARARMRALGLSDRVDIRIQDYRDVDGQFDSIVSIEMFEAVGERYWPTYLETLKARLAAGGRAALQIITIDEDAFEGYKRTPDFIQRYIFPGGMLPPPKRFAHAVDAAELRVADTFFFGPCYAETLRRWDTAFREAWPTIRTLGFDDRFFRMWHYYLRYCEIGFETGRIDVAHFLIEQA